MIVVFSHQWLQHMASTTTLTNVTMTNHSPPSRSSPPPNQRIIQPLNGKEPSQLLDPLNPCPNGFVRLQRDVAHRRQSNVHENTDVGDGGPAQDQPFVALEPLL